MQQQLLLGIVWFCLAAMLFSYQLIIFFTIDTVVEEYDNGIIYMISETGYTAKGTFYTVFESGESDVKAYENRMGRYKQRDI